MDIKKWQPDTLIDCVIFDCDGTLTSIEGIDVLAENNGVSEKVKNLTSVAMGQSGINPQIYKERLDLVYPSERSTLRLGQHYIQNCIPDTQEVIKLFQRLNKSLYIVSAGLYPAVALFADFLKIPRSNIFAVPIHFNENGEFIDYDHQSPLITSMGKKDIVNQLKPLHHQMAYLGDGLNDLAAKDLVSRFIGYGGIYYRENIRAASDYYITAPFLAALLPLILTAEECAALNPSEKALYEKGMIAIQQGEVSAK